VYENGRVNDLFGHISIVAQVLYVVQRRQKDNPEANHFEADSRV
jgi:hypothetical protein